MHCEPALCPVSYNDDNNDDGDGDDNGDDNNDDGDGGDNGDGDD